MHACLSGRPGATSGLAGSPGAECVAHHVCHWRTSGWLCQTQHGPAEVVGRHAPHCHGSCQLFVAPVTSSARAGGIRLSSTATSVSMYRWNDAVAVVEGLPCAKCRNSVQAGRVTRGGYSHPSLSTPTPTANPCRSHRPSTFLLRLWMMLTVDVKLWSSREWKLD